MGTIRFLAVAFGLFFAAFLGVKWLFEVRPLTPDARVPTFQRVDTELPRYKIEQSSVSDNDPTRDRLRNEVRDYAKALGDDPCNPVLKAHYVNAVVAYARAWISIVPCLGTQTCRSADSPLLDRAAQAFGSPLDMRVREAMAAVHAKGAFGPADFPKDTIHLVATLAADRSINSAEEMKEFRRVKAQLGGDGGRRQDCGR
jgi:hypothetical protein